MTAAASAAGVLPGADARELPSSRVMARLDLRFLAGLGWDPGAQVLAPPPGHRLLREASGPVTGGPSGCAVSGCERGLPASADQPDVLLRGSSVSAA